MASERSMEFQATKDAEIPYEDVLAIGEAIMKGDIEKAEKIAAKYGLLIGEPQERCTFKHVGRQCTLHAGHQGGHSIAAGAEPKLYGPDVMI